MLARPRGMCARLCSGIVTVLETLLRGIRTHDGAVLRARLDPGEEYAVPVGSPLVLCGVLAGEVVAAGEAVPPGGVVMVQPGSLGDGAGGRRRRVPDHVRVPLARGR